MSDERRLAAKLASTRVREPVNWPAEKDFTDVNRVPEPREHYFQHDAGGARARATPRSEMIHARVRVDRPGRPILTVPSASSPTSQATGRRASSPASPSTPRVPSVRATPPSRRSIAIDSSPRVGRRRRPRRRRHDRVRTRRAE